MQPLSPFPKPSLPKIFLSFTTWANGILERTMYRNWWENTNNFPKISAGIILATCKDINWHLIGHLQTNKVKYIAPFVHLIHGVDSLSLLKEINKQALKNNRIIDCLLQIYIAKEETKFGLDEHELSTLLSTDSPINGLTNIQINGLMGMASFSTNMDLVRAEFNHLKNLFDQYTQPPTTNHKPQTTNLQLQTLSMGMSSDYKIAIEEGSNMVRIGSLLFGERNYTL